MLLICTIVTSNAQDHTVSGKVSAAMDGEPIPGVAVKELGTQNGTITDIDGNYTINCRSDATLEFSAIGFTTITEAVQGRTIIDVCMEVDSDFLEDRMNAIFQALLRTSPVLLCATDR